MPKFASHSVCLQAYQAIHGHPKLMWLSRDVSNMIGTKLAFNLEVWSAGTGPLTSHCPQQEHPPSLMLETVNRNSSRVEAEIED